MESVQRRATKIIPGFEELNYRERLERLGLYSMEYRRKRGDMIQVFKILNSIDRVDPNYFFKINERSSRKNSKKLFKPRHNKDVRGNSFSHRVIDDWNSLPENVTKAETVNAFKNRLDKAWKEHWYTYRE